MLLDRRSGCLFKTQGPTKVEGGGDWWRFYASRCRKIGRRKRVRAHLHHPQTHDLKDLIEREREREARDRGERHLQTVGVRVGRA